MQTSAAALMRWIRGWDSSSRVAFAILTLVGLNSVAWAVIGADVPDEGGYFEEVIALADTGVAETRTGHVVGVFAYSAAVLVHAGRLLGVSDLLSVRLLGAACVTLTALCALLVARRLTDRSFVPLAALTLVGLNPMFTFIGSSANSDTMQALWSSFAFVVMAELLVGGPTVTAAGLLLLSLGLVRFTKQNRSILVNAAALTAVTLVSLMESRGFVRGAWRLSAWARTRRGLVACTLILAALCVPTPLRNSLLVLNPSSAWLRSSIYNSGERTLPSAGEFIAFLGSNEGQVTAKHFWGYFGLLHVPGPTAFYHLGGALLVWAGIGAAVALGACAIRNEKVTAEPADGDMRRSVGRMLGWWLLAISVTIGLYAILEYATQTQTIPQGRYLLTLIVPVGVLISAGIAHATPRRVEHVILAFLLLLMVVANAWALIYLVLPYHY